MNSFSNDNLKEWLQNLQLHDIVLLATNQVSSAITTHSLHPAGIDPDGHIVYDLHVKRTVEPICPIKEVKMTFTVARDGVNFDKNSTNDLK